MAFKTFLTSGVATIALAALAGCNDTAPGEGTAEAASISAAIEARQANFKAIGKANKALKSALEESTPSLARIAEAAASLNASAGKIAGFFPEGSGLQSGEKTEALPAIWTKPDEFRASADKLVVSSAALRTAAASGDLAAVQAAMKDVGATCKGCHDTFREKKQ